MKINQIIQCGVLSGSLALATPQSSLAGLKIRPVFIGGEPPPASSIAGGGNLQAIFEEAAKQWERVYNKGGDKWEVTIEYGWGDTYSNGYAYAYERMVDQGGSPVRITHSRIIFRNTVARPADADWYADPTPKNNSEYRLFTTTIVETTDENGNPLGEINAGRVFSEPTGLAVGRMDLLTTAMHEIGHSLGLDGDYDGFTSQISGTFLTITPPLPFADYFVALSLGFGDHIEAAGDTPLMVISLRPGYRQFITGLDALVLAQFSSFARPDLGTPPGLPKGE